MSGQRLAASLALLLLWSAGATTFAADIAKFGDPAAPMTVFWAKGQLIVGVLPEPNEGYIQLAARLLEHAEDYQDVLALNANRAPMRGVHVWVPLVRVKLALRGDALRALYPEDDLTERGWSHRVNDPLETLIQLTEAYTGSKARFKELARLNALRNPDVLRLGTEIVVPLQWIPEELGFRPLGLQPPLKLTKDPASGQNYALYTVQPGDTLYSLLLRFTDRERADEVRRMSELLVSLNGLPSEMRLPVGRTLRIPVGWLSEEYLVQKRAPGRAERPPVAVKRPPPSGGILHVIVDPGHGGVDSGAVYGSRHGERIYEHEVVYDIALRAMGYLQARKYAVYPTLLDPRHPDPVRKLTMANLGDEAVQVNPPYKVTSARVGVNMRVYLVDALFRKLTRRKGVAPEDILLISIHGDALVPTLRGAMAYYPDHRLRVSEFAPRGRVYRQRREAVPLLIRFDRAEMRTAMDLSAEFAQDILDGLERQGVPVSRRKPVRSFYYRNGERTLPAVLRYSRVPTSVLLEVANLNNAADRRALLDHRNRDRIARGIVDAVDRYRDRRGTVAARLGGG
ncbi:MAG: N-acetylmuramoyl-L-alanine amidase [Candidatus Lambdaproteobacteria bacterium]|nr:N-acetylmuramoyl-L-alanine amidase [Candidatus Lambdaproteobacteria bacterium]